MTIAASKVSEPAPHEHDRLLIDSVIDFAIYRLNADGRVCSWNTGAERIKGYTEAEIFGEHFSRFFTPSDRKAGLPALALETAARDGRFESEGWRVQKNGTSFWAQAVINVVTGPGGQTLGFVKITRDLSERRRAEHALRQSEQRFAHLVQAVTDYAIYMLDTQGVVVNWNQGAERINGYREAEIVGRHFSDFYMYQDRSSGEPQRNLRWAVRDGRFQKEGWRVRRDGSRFWANVVITPILDTEGLLLGFAKVTRDMTEQVRSQSALERTREAFFQSQKIAAIGQLNAGITHDFNNVLTSVLGNLETLRMQSSSDAKLAPTIDKALLGAERGVALTKRMLNFARERVHPSDEVEIPVLIQGMGRLLKQSVGSTISIETRFPIDLPPIDVDPHQLELALINLVINARDAMPSGGTITITARESSYSDPVASSPRSVVVAISDTGQGMDNETLAHALEPFFTTKKLGMGTGLGLSMVLGLAEQSGGQLTLKSEKGVGTVVELALPIALSKRRGERAIRPAVHIEVQEASPEVQHQEEAESDAETGETTRRIDDDHWDKGASKQPALLESLEEQSHNDNNLEPPAFPVVVVAQQVGLVKNSPEELPSSLISGDRSGTSRSSAYDRMESNLIKSMLHTRMEVEQSVAQKSFSRRLKGILRGLWTGN
ncbi:PAS domain S-box protein [Lichenifustis flavocetrariae]|uniref:histidine kinase n=1 Tax=Lichenifustis flavocetrariae TaxID=2949735 RepID=A0AA41Z2L5_9HYPH|nr:PAS domain S-box protein [Lichenifustis flavocetrariae]MCW6513064.1 PAS domain S-box protein [Lichenifustis flavocetrariae]